MSNINLHDAMQLNRHERRRLGKINNTKIYGVSNKLPQRKSNKSMSGEELLTKAFTPKPSKL